MYFQTGLLSHPRSFYVKYCQGGTLDIPPKIILVPSQEKCLATGLVNLLIQDFVLSGHFVTNPFMDVYVNSDQLGGTFALYTDAVMNQVKHKLKFVSIIFFVNKQFEIFLQYVHCGICFSFDIAGLQTVLYVI